MKPKAWVPLVVLAVLGVVALGIWVLVENPGPQGFDKRKFSELLTGELSPEPEPASGPESELKELLLRDLEGWRLVAEGPSEGAPREAKGEPPVPSWSGQYCRDPEGCRAKVIDLSIALFRFSSEELARKWLGQARFRAQRNAPYEEAFEVGDFQSDYDLVPDFKGEEGFYLADERKAKGKELWLRLGRIVVVMHSGMETDLLELAQLQGERVVRYDGTS